MSLSVHGWAHMSHDCRTKVVAVLGMEQHYVGLSVCQNLLCIYFPYVEHQHVATMPEPEWTNQIQRIKIYCLWQGTQKVNLAICLPSAPPPTSVCRVM